ncbi:hypothetical protein CSUI_009356 [Cystoisospora suis]|uniref:Uncharacterized protein n=1 Tax=Cystoisospora suis TaxID=483139 RepID=A0A2C6KKC3_9APIC|nr:hypothetical protein CSUI_009356 [Cystoisospora suis]
MCAQLSHNLMQHPVSVGKDSERTSCPPLHLIFLLNKCNSLRPQQEQPRHRGRFFSSGR